MRVGANILAQRFREILFSSTTDASRTACFSPLSVGALWRSSPWSSPWLQCLKKDEKTWKKNWKRFFPVWEFTKKCSAWCEWRAAVGVINSFLVVSLFSEHVRMRSGRRFSNNFFLLRFSPLKIYADDLISFRFKSSTLCWIFKRCLCACDGEIMCEDGRRVERQFILRLKRIYLLP